MSTGRLERWRNTLMRLYPGLGLILVFLGPYFFFQSLSFLRITDYVAGTLAFLAGWALLRAGIDLTRAYLAAGETVESRKSKVEGQRSEGNF